MNSKSDDFDFGHWAEAARSDPDRFEAMREEALEEFIRTAPEDYRQRLSGLQFRIDLERRRSRTPLAACIRISQLMMSKLHDESIPALRMETLPESGDRARVLPFRDRQGNRGG